MILYRTANVLEEALIQWDWVISSPLHIKLGLIKQFVKLFDKNEEWFEYNCSVFPDLMIEKLKAGIIDEPQTCMLLNDTNFVKTMSENEVSEWLAFAEVVHNFLWKIGKHKRENNRDLLPIWNQLFISIDANRSIKVCFIFSHLDRFPGNLGVVSDRKGEGYH